MKTKKIMLLAVPLIGLLFILSSGNKLYAQTDTVNNSPKGGSMKMAAPGFAATMYQLNMTKGSHATHTFTPVGIAVFPIVKFNDRLFLDCAAEFNANSDGSTEAAIGELVGFYRINPYVTAFLGNFSPHYGIYLGILDDFTDRFGTGVGPIGMGHGLGNQNGVGIQGGFQAGYSKLTYQLYAANGPQLQLDSTTLDGGNVTGQLSYDSYADNNKNKSIGGHIGFLPFSNSCLEVTLSGEYAAKTGPADTKYENISAMSWATGLNYFHLFSPIMVRVQAEYDMIQTKNYDYPLMTSDTTVSVNKFDNKSNGWYAGATLRATGSKKMLIKNLELAGRIGAYAPPKDALWGGPQMNQTTITLTYWLTWAIPLSFEYDMITQSGAPTQQYFSTVVFFRF